MTQRSLDDLAMRCGCDKQRGRESHGYVRYYEQLFTPMRNEPVKLLEIGVARARSIWMWARFFENGTIYGLDNKEFMDGEDYMKVRGEADMGKVKLITADQSSIPQLEDVIEKYGPFDIIIDDGSHVPAHQITSFSTLFPACTKYYAIEDMHPGYRGTKHPTIEYMSERTIGQLNKFGNSRYYDVEFNPGYLDIEWVMFPANMILVKKRQDIYGF